MWEIDNIKMSLDTQCHLLHTKGRRPEVMVTWLDWNVAPTEVGGGGGGWSWWETSWSTSEVGIIFSTRVILSMAGGSGSVRHTSLSNLCCDSNRHIDLKFIPTLAKGHIKNYTKFRDWFAELHHCDKENIQTSKSQYSTIGMIISRSAHREQIHYTKAAWKFQGD